jgi:DNA invertase Pin-like site-specific DNA recombinase
MTVSLDPPLTPKSGRTLKVLGVARISTEHQDKRSFDDQKNKMREYVGNSYAGPVDWQFIASQGSGETLDRVELFQAEQLIESGGFDLLIAEDLARICRRKRAYDFCELCVDSQTRLIAINDRVDTAQDGWEDGAFISTWHHERSNRDTSQRIRRSLRNRFMQGGVVQTTVFGIVKPPGAKTDGDLYKDPAAQPVYDEVFRRLEQGANFSGVADWLNARQVPLPSYARSARWTCSLLSQLIHNPILKGVRVRNKKMSKRINETGRRRSVAAPAGERLERHCPHLAFVDPDRYDRLIRLLDRRNGKYKRKGSDGVDPRKGVPKKRSAWPGQHLRCGVCGRIFHWTGVGPRKMMTCSGAATYRCWNSLLLNGATATRKLTEAIFAAVVALPDFDETFQEKVRREAGAVRDRQAARRQELTRLVDACAGQVARVTDAVAESRGSRSLLEKLRELEAQQVDLEQERAALDRAPAPRVELPAAEELKELKERARGVFTS